MKFTYKKYLAHQFSIMKIQKTSLLPWLDVLETAPFFTQCEAAAVEYNKLATQQDIRYLEAGNKNLADRKLQIVAAKENETMPKADITETEMLTESGLCVSQLEKKSKELDDLQNKEIEGIEIHVIDIKVIQMLYDKSQARREKQIASGHTPEEDKLNRQEPFFTNDDVRTYIVIGLTKP